MISSSVGSLVFTKMNSVSFRGNIILESWVNIYRKVSDIGHDRIPQKSFL
jgi:hypothetical protein